MKSRIFTVRKCFQCGMIFIWCVTSISSLFWRASPVFTNGQACDELLLPVTQRRNDVERFELPAFFWKKRIKNALWFRFRYIKHCYLLLWCEENRNIFAAYFHETVWVSQLHNRNRMFINLHTSSSSSNSFRPIIFIASNLMLKI